MPQLFDITTSILYKEGLEKGLEKGLEEGLEIGLEKGLEEGLKKKAIILVVNMLSMSDIPVGQIARLVRMDVNFVKQIKTKIDTGEWSNPEYWTAEEWAAYFKNKT